MANVIVKTDDDITIYNKLKLIIDDNNKTALEDAFNKVGVERFKQIADDGGLLFYASGIVIEKEKKRGSTKQM